MRTLEQKGFIVALLFFCLISSAQVESQWRSGIVRVNTDVSAGLESFDEVAQKAADSGLDFIVFSDQLIVHAEYGIIPFEHVFKISRSRKSITSFGVEEYLAKIRKADMQFPDMVLIPGADIAPHYYWTGIPFSNTFMTNQFSEQLTVFGPLEPEFYRSLPVIHNEKTVFSSTSFLKLLPLLLVVLGMLIFFLRKKGGYTDQQGNIYDPCGKRICLFMGILFIIVGLAWTIENRPFTEGVNFDQYKNFGVSPYQQVIDYIRDNAKDGKCAIFWSAPEAKMKVKLFGAKLISIPYLNDILATKGHNGFAGIYGDALTAQKPGHEWDKLLIEYCQGKRKIKPVILGELDYHGKGRKIDLIQTVVAVDKFDADSILKAICEGKSYAYANVRKNKLIIEEISMRNKNDSASMGDTLEVAENEDVEFFIKGRIEGEDTEKNVTSITLISNGKAIRFRKTTGSDFEIKFPLKFNLNAGKKGYVRFLLETNQAGFIYSNPIFYVETMHASSLRDL